MTAVEACAHPLCSLRSLLFLSRLAQTFIVFMVDLFQVPVLGPWRAALIVPDKPNLGLSRVLSADLLFLSFKFSRVQT